MLTEKVKTTSLLATCTSVVEQKGRDVLVEDGEGKQWHEHALDVRVLKSVELDTFNDSVDPLSHYSFSKLQRRLHPKINE